MKKAFILTLFASLLLSFSGCSNESVSRSKAKDNAKTTAENSENGTGSEVNTETTSTTDTTGTLSITTPTRGEEFNTASNWNVIRGTVPANTYSIEVNGYKLRKYTPGSTDWNYIAAEKMQTLKDGLNEYAVKALDKEGKTIQELTYKINYDNKHTLPNVGASLNLMILISLITGGLLFTRRKTS